MSRKEMDKDEIVEDQPLVSEEGADAGADEAEETQENPVIEESRDDAEEVDEVEALKAEVNDLKEKILRMAAENQNTRKRLVKQQQDAYQYRHQDILRDLAEVIDNFERAIESSTDSKDFDSFHEGILMIEKQFSGMLTERYGLERIGVEGETFDPSAHEAMMMEESSEVKEDTVKQVFQAGYRLHDRVLRPAKVVIFKPAQATETESAAEDGD